MLCLENGFGLEVYTHRITMYFMSWAVQIMKSAFYTYFSKYHKCLLINLSIFLLRYNNCRENYYNYCFD